MQARRSSPGTPPDRKQNSAGKHVFNNENHLLPTVDEEKINIEVCADYVLR
jgi:hypothetical protein